ncbi:MAG: glycosyltransferase family 2 protein [Patescibacteria group bacterium]
MKLSALVLAKNEEEVIEDCLKQLDFVEEIVVLDQDSQDKTVEIAKKYTDKIIQTRKENFSENRNTLLKEAIGDWVLYVDCDERINDKLKSEIISCLQSRKYCAYFFPRKNIILGKWLKHGGWWPDYVPRLFKKKDLIKWQGDVHESPVVKEQFGYTKNFLTHLTARNISQMLKKTTKWAQIEANLKHQANHPPVNLVRVLKVMIIEFVNRYIIKLGFLDGLVGLIQAIFQAFHQAAVLVYLWELQNKTYEKFLKVKDE